MTHGSTGCQWQELFLPLLERESGLYCGQFLHTRLREQLERACCERIPFSILLVRGEPMFRRRLQPAGVRAVSSLLMTVARPEDVAARLQPRLFALLLAGVDEEAAARVARLVELELHVAAAGTGDRWRVGFLSFPRQREDLERLVENPRKVPVGAISAA